jgi:aromatic-L-amino-acid/L-tryptophan decarboxylase
VSRPGPVPDLDWDAARAREIGTVALDLWTELLERLPRMPAAPDQTAVEVAADIGGISGEPASIGDMVGRLRPLLFERSSLTGHPGFMAYVSGSGTIPGAAADLIASGLNPNVGGWTLSPAATELELALTAWLAQDVFGLPDGAGGLMTSGGAASDFTALKAARDRAGGPEIRRGGVQGERLAMYTSAEAHATNAEAADVLGLGSDAMRIVAADEHLRMRPDALDHRLSADVSAGVRPAAVIASAGTTATGVIDPLNAIADVCARHGAWLHVDAAYGGAAMLAPGLRPLLAGIERADSIAFDPHKWLYTPQPSACLLVREPAALRRSFSIDAAYVRDDPGLSGRGINLGELSQAWSRPWMALKVWLSLLAHGAQLDTELR